MADILGTTGGRHILVETDIDSVPAVSDEFGDSNATITDSSFSATKEYARRPLRGLQIKEETPATLSILGPGNTGIAIANSSAKSDKLVNFTSNFLLQAVTISRIEKFQPVTTFGNTYGFFFGENPVMITFAATLLNSADFQWQIEWWDNYAEFFRGTALTDRNVRAYMEYDDKVIEGYITTAVTVENATTHHEVALNFTMWATNVTYRVTPGSRLFAESGVAQFPDFSLDPTDALGNHVSSTAAVRAANIDAQSQSGLVSWLRTAANATNSYVGATGGYLGIAKAALFGRTVVIPAGFAASDFNAGPAVFASGSGADALNLNQFVSVRLPPEFSNSEIKPRTTYYDNRDEYPFVGSSSPLTAEELEQQSDLVRSEFGVVRTGRELVVGEDGMEVEITGDSDIYERAEKAWADVGFAGTTNQLGGGLSSQIALDVLRAMYGVVSYGASFGTSQALADVSSNPLNASVNAVTGQGFTNTIGVDAVAANPGV